MRLFRGVRNGRRLTVNVSASEWISFLIKHAEYANVKCSQTHEWRTVTVQCSIKAKYALLNQLGIKTKGDETPSNEGFMVNGKQRGVNETAHCTRILLLVSRLDARDKGPKCQRRCRSCVSEAATSRRWNRVDIWAASWQRDLFRKVTERAPVLWSQDAIFRSFAPSGASDNPISVRRASAQEAGG